MALLQMLRSPDLTGEDAQWVEQFAVRIIAEYNLLKSKRNGDTSGASVAA